MNREHLRHLLEAFEQGSLDIDGALSALERLPYEDVGFARIDHHRQLRTGAPEVIFAQGKTAPQVAHLVHTMHGRGTDVMATRLDADKARDAVDFWRQQGWGEPAWNYDAVSRVLVWRQGEFVDRGRGHIAVVCAGTSDIPVAQEALRTAEFLGNRCELTTDVGVAGLHRLLSVREKLSQAEVIVAVAGMEGALPGVLTGLVDRPVIGVPVSVGYGVSQGGFAALATMLSSCAAGLTVVNIDNGFGAAIAASSINRKRTE